MRVLLLAVVVVCGCQKSTERVVMYSAQDRDFGEPILEQFRKQHSLAVECKWDTEANKSVSLAAELMAEAGRPRADVHWNNEPINTIRLARQGIYEVYRSSAAEGFPDWSRPKDGQWQAFAARARVMIVNTNLVPEDRRPKSIFDLNNPEWKGRAAIAKPLFGTTATHAACLFDVLGPEQALQFFKDLQANDVSILPGNKGVAVDVAAGKFAFGLTDTDDAIIELNAGKPVAIIYPDRDGHPGFPRLGVLYLPNTLALVKGGPNPDGGRKLIDFLLSQTVEEKLAQGGGYQIPLNPALADAKLPDAILPPQRVKRMEADFEKAADLWDEVQAAMRNLFAR